MPRIVRRGSRTHKQTKQSKVVDIECIENRSTEKRKAETNGSVSLPLQEMDPNNNQKRHCPMQVQESWLPLAYTRSVTPEPMDQVDGGRLFLRHPFAPPKKVDGFRTRNDVINVPAPRPSPLPEIKWAEPRELWLNILRKEAMHVRNPDWFRRHPALQPRMRAILLDWLIEVSQMYRLHRETYYLAMDFVDRFMAVEKEIRQQKLQLIGVTALFIAAKAEEIYPPKLTEFAYVTDGACSEEEILVMEIKMLESLKWDLTPMTPNSWLILFLQLVNAHVFRDTVTSEFHMPQFSANSFVQIIRLLDLCTLDPGSLKFPYSVLTTSAVYHMAAEPEDALTISGFQYADVSSCVEWMAPFTQTVAELGLLEIRTFTNIATYDQHNIQTHVVDTYLLENAQSRQEKHESPVLREMENRSSPELNKLGVLTPPQSGKKQDVVI